MPHLSWFTYWTIYRYPRLCLAGCFADARRMRVACTARSAHVRSLSSIKEELHLALDGAHTHSVTRWRLPGTTPVLAGREAETRDSGHVQ